MKVNNMNQTFTVESGGKTYQCERAVTGRRKHFQTVRVLGFGSRKDLSVYGKKYKPVETMEQAARIIAQQIIDKAQH